MNRQALIIALLVGLLGGAAFQATATQSAPAPASVCGNASAAQLRTTLYFGTTRPTGAVSELEWQMFLRDEVTQRLLVHPDTAKARGSVQDVIEKYRKAFEQESVLWETASVCIAS